MQWQWTTYKLYLFNNALKRKNLEKWLTIFFLSQHTSPIINRAIFDSDS